MAPRLVLTAGVHASASTWVFNVARELLLSQFGPAALACCHYSGRGALPGAAASCVLAKTHGWPGLAALVESRRPTVLLSVRDPRDAVVSQMQRFGMTFPDACTSINQDFTALAACRAAGPVLRFEDRFFADPATIRLIAAELKVPGGDALVAEIFASYDTASVRAFAASVADLPPAQRDGGGNFWFDRRTQITNTHIGDGQTGKWRQALKPHQQWQATRYFAPALAAFNYAI